MYFGVGIKVLGDGVFTDDVSRRVRWDTTPLAKDEKNVMETMMVKERAS